MSHLSRIGTAGICEIQRCGGNGPIRWLREGDTTNATMQHQGEQRVALTYSCHPHRSGARRAPQFTRFLMKGETCTQVFLFAASSTRGQRTCRLLLSRLKDGLGAPALVVVPWLLAQATEDHAAGDEALGEEEQKRHGGQ